MHLWIGKKLLDKNQNKGETMYNDKILKSVAEAVKQVVEAELSTKQKAIAKIAEPKHKIDSGDLAGLRAGKKPVTESDLPTSKAPQKTVTVRHKTSEREKVIVDTPEARKRNAEMGYHPVKEEAEQKKQAGIDKSMDNQRRISAETMTRKQFIDVHGDEHAHVWDKVNKGMKEEVEQVDEAQSHQAITTMKHISKPTAGEMKAAKDMKPGVAGYRDRIAMLKSAEARGALKKEEVEQVDEMEVANKYALKGPQKSEVPAYMRKAKGATPLKLADLKRKDTMSDLENLRKMEEVDTAPVSEILEQIDAFTIELPEELSYEDYLRSAMFAEGVSSLSELEDDFLPSFLQYVQEKFESGDEDFVISELTYSEMQDRIYMHQKQGNKVTGVERKTVSGKPYAAYVVTDKTGMRRKYIYHGNVRRVENLGQGSASQTVKPGQTDPNEE